MNVVMSISVHEPLQKQQVFEIGKVINKIHGSTVVGGKGQKVASLSRRDGRTVYDFEFDVEQDENICDVIANELYNALDFDFEMEIDCEVNEDFLAGYDGDSDEQLLIEDEPSVVHSKWLSQRIEDGWRFGTEYSEEDKTDPLMRPYHALSARQQALALGKH